MESTLDELKQQTIRAHTAGHPLVIRGGGTKDFYGEPFSGVDAQASILDLSAYKGVVNYQPSELVITARAGTLLSEVERTLAEQQQMLAFEPPRLGSASTLGGCLASGLSGPRRMAAGSLRDFVLGTQLLSGSGSVLSFGGEVMKNVAGYDISRLLAGSMGILGPVVQMSLKVVPMPASELTLALDMSEAQALRALSQWRGLPLPITATAWTLESPQGHGLLRVRLSGSAAAIRQGRSQIGGQEVADLNARDFWTSLRDQTHDFFQHGLLWRVAVPPTTGPLNLGSSLIEWNGGQRWLADLTVSPNDLRQNITARGGHATLYRYQSKPELPVFHPVHAGLKNIHRRLKQEFDPSGVFNPRRLFPDF